jgi:hypothetical protein
MVAEREAGLREETTGVVPGAGHHPGQAAIGYLISGAPGAGKSTGIGFWLDSSQQTPLQTVEAILSHEAEAAL